MVDYRLRGIIQYNPSCTNVAKVHNQSLDGLNWDNHGLESIYSIFIVIFNNLSFQKTSFNARI